VITPKVHVRECRQVRERAERATSSATSEAWQNQFYRILQEIASGRPRTYASFLHICISQRYFVIMTRLDISSVLCAFHIILQLKN